MVGSRPLPPLDYLTADLHHYEANIFRGIPFFSSYVCAIDLGLLRIAITLASGKAAAVWPPDEIIELIGTHLDYISEHNSRMTSDPAR